MNAEMDEHLGYNKHQKTNFENSRNGYSSKNIWSLFGETRIKTPRDRYSSFEPIIVEKTNLIFLKLKLQL